MKRLISIVFILLLLFIVGCGSNKDKVTFDNTNTINLVSREDGSGTRRAFVEILGILEKHNNGNESDNTYEEAIIQNSTDAIMTTIAGDKYSIGYISLSSLNNMIKVLNINGTEATLENIQNGSYPISRPFNIVYEQSENKLRDDFISFILSSLGQDVILQEGFVQSINDPSKYIKSRQKGRLVIAGSTSVSPIMEKLAEEYKIINPAVVIEIQSTGSSAGIQSVVEKSVDIGMVSRDLKDSEKEKLKHLTIALDGIVTIVNKNNPLDNISLEDIRSIYMGNIVSWNEIKR